MIKLEYLKDEEVWGDNALGIFDKLEQGRKAVLSDFARCMEPHIDDGSGQGYYWTKTDDGSGNVQVVLINGSEGYGTTDDIGIGGRPATRYSDLQKIAPHGIQGETPEGVTTFMAGTYLQNKVNPETAKKLTSMMEAGKLPLTEEEPCEIDYKDLRDLRFDLLELPRYTFRGKQYTLYSIFGPIDDVVKMSDGSIVEYGSDHWFEWQPIVWLIDEEKDRAITQDILFTGIAMDNKKTYDGNLEETMTGHFLREFAKEIKLDKDFIVSLVYESKEKTGFSLRKLFGIVKNKETNDD